MVNRTRTLFFALGLLVGIAGTFAYSNIADESSNRRPEIRENNLTPGSDRVRQTQEFDRNGAPSARPPNDAAGAQGEISIVASIEKIRGSKKKKFAFITVEQIVSTNGSRGQDNEVDPNENTFDRRIRPTLIPGEAAVIRISPEIEEDITAGRYFALIRMLPFEDPSAAAIALQLRRLERDSNRDIN